MHGPVTLFDRRRQTRQPRVGPPSVSLRVAVALDGYLTAVALHNEPVRREHLVLAVHASSVGGASDAEVPRRDRTLRPAPDNRAPRWGRRRRTVGPRPARQSVLARRQQVSAPVNRAALHIAEVPL